MIHKPDSGSQTPEFDSQALLPCPFCGGEVRIICDDFINGRPIDDPDVYIECDTPTCIFDYRAKYKHRDAMIECWNTRADIAEAQAAQIARLTAENERLAKLLDDCATDLCSWGDYRDELIRLGFDVDYSVTLGNRVNAALAERKGTEQ